MVEEPRARQVLQCTRSANVGAATEDGCTNLTLRVEACPVVDGCLAPAAEAQGRSSHLYKSRRKGEDVELCHRSHPPPDHSLRPRLDREAGERRVLPRPADRGSARARRQRGLRGLGRGSGSWLQRGDPAATRVGPCAPSCRGWRSVGSAGAGSRPLSERIDAPPTPTTRAKWAWLRA